MKKLLSFGFLLLFSYILFAEFRTIDTKYFSIVYDNDYSELAANHLANNADKIAEEVFAFCDVEPWKSKMPVYLKPNQQQLNGYYTSSPYDHIVLFDALPNDNIISNNTKNLLSVFKHEFTHAVSLSGFFSFTFPHAMREGIAVISESLKDEGRLNDPRVFQIIKQAKIDIALPKWNELDMKDIYSYGNDGYVYGAAFLDFLRKAYGEKRYIDFWNMHPKWFSNRNFKLAFGKSVDELLVAFYQTIKVPDNVVNPENFFANSKKSLYSATASYKNHIALADSSKRCVYLYDANSGEGKKLFSIATNIYNLSFSQNGKFLLASSFYEQNDEVHSVVYVYDLENNKFTDEKYYSLRYATFSFDSNFICATESTSQSVKLVLINRTTKEKRDLLQLDFRSDYTNIYNVVGVSKTNYAVILGNGIKRDIFIISEKGDLEKLNIPLEVKAIGDLAPLNTESENGFTFSYILDDSLLRMGYYNATKKELKLLKKDISGGTNYPIFVQTNSKKNNFATGKTFLVVAKHPTYDLLCRVNETELDTLPASMLPLKLSVEHTEETKFSDKKYNPIMNMWIPSVSPYFIIGSNFKNTSYGLSLSSQDPINRLSYKLSVAIMPIPTFAQLGFIGSLNLKGNLLSLSINDNVSVNTKYRRTGFDFKNTKSIFVGKNNASISFNTQLGSYWYSKIDFSKKNIYKEKFTDTVIQIDQEIAVLYYKRFERLENKFFALDVYGLQNNLDFSVAYNVQKKLPALQLQDSFKFTTPVVPFSLELFAGLSYNSQLDPLLGKYIFANSDVEMGNTYFPTMTEHSKFYEQQKAAKLNYYFGGQASLRVFSVEIQKVLSWLPLCFNRFNIDVGYKALLDQAFSKNQSFLHSAFAKASFVVNGAAEVGLIYSHPIVKGATQGSFDFSFKLSF